MMRIFDKIHIIISAEIVKHRKEKMMRNLFDYSSSSNQSDITDEINLSENMDDGDSLMVILEGKEKAANKKWSFTNEFPFPKTNCFSSSAPLPNLVLQNLLNTPTKSRSSKRTFGAAFAPDPTPKPYPGTSRLLGGLNEWDDNEANKRCKMMENVKDDLPHRSGMDFQPFPYQKSSHLSPENNTHLFGNMKRNSLMTILEGRDEDETPTKHQSFTNEFPFPYERRFPLNAFRQDLNLNLMKTPTKSNSKRNGGFDLSPYPTSNSGITRLFGGPDRRSTRPAPRYF